MSRVNPKIFHAYDIRGIYPDELNKEAAYKIGRAFIKFLKSKFHNSRMKIVIGRDCRLSSPKIFKAFSQGIIEEGANVINIGKVSTDVLYFALHYFKTDGAAMITASHNPPEYNGIKMLAKGSKYICADWGIPEIKEIVLKDKFNRTYCRKGKIVKKNVIQEYARHILKLVELKSIRELKVVVDAGNGMGGKVIKEIAAKIPIKLIPLYFQPNGSFPNHLPNPLISSATKDIQKRVVKKKADFGLALDGDGDRTIFIDEKGKIISGDLIIALFAEYFLKNKPGENIVYNLTCSKVVPEVIKNAGGNPIRTRTGHAFMKEAARKSKAIFGGEISGHLYFRDMFYAESAGLVLLIMLKILSENKKPLSILIKKYKKYYRVGEINFKVKKRQETIKKIARIYKKGKQDWLDGLTVEFKNWWFNLRPSNTEPLLRLVIEAKNKKQLEKRKREIEKLIIGKK